RVCAGQSGPDAERFGLFVDDRGYKAHVSAVEAEGGRVGVIVLLVRESGAEARLNSFGREIREPLDDLAGCLASVAAHATEPAQRTPIADAVRCLDRVRKWTDTVAASLKVA